MYRSAVGSYISSILVPCRTSTSLSNGGGSFVAPVSLSVPVSPFGCCMSDAW